MVKKIISKSEFARLCGVSPAAVTKACNSSLKGAVSGKRIDANHPDAVKYLAKVNGDQTDGPATAIDPLYEDVVAFLRERGSCAINPVKKHFKIGHSRAARIVNTMKAAEVDLQRTKSRKKPTPPPAQDDTILEVPEDIQKFGDMTLRQLIEKFGTSSQFVDWLNATQKIESINEKRLKNAKTKGELVSRDLIKIGIIDPIEEAHIKMLTDGARTIAKRLSAMSDAGSDLETMEKFVKDQIGSFIRPVKNKVARTLRNA